MRGELNSDVTRLVLQKLQSDVHMEDELKAEFLYNKIQFSGFCNVVDSVVIHSSIRRTYRFVLKYWNRNI